MDITEEKVDNLNAILKIQIGKEDYESRVGDVLKDYKKKVRLDGFRPGMVPVGLIKKMYGKAVLIEEINKIISESISKYLIDKDLKILGEPLPSDKEQKTIDWDNQTDFEFAFDLGLAPEFDMNLSKKDKIAFYKIKIDQKLRDTYIENYTRRYGTFTPVEMAGEKEMLKGSIRQIDAEGNITENGIYAEDTSFSIEIIKDKKIKDKFVGTRIKDVINFDIKKAFPNDQEIASILYINKDDVPALSSDFQFTINEISRFENAELNQEFFDKAFGKDKVKTVEEFEILVENEIKNNLTGEEEFKFSLDVKEKTINKLEIELPVEFLKKWLFRINEGKVAKEEIDKDFEKFEKDLKWQLIKDKVIKENEIKITEDEALDYAKKVTLMQFQQYGMTNISDEQLENYARELLKKEEENKRIYEKKYEEKVIEFIKELVKIDLKEVTTDEFNKLFDKK
ncbi:MAG: trigger factor [Bacteroidetes bacterium]|nr:trigger factor [Bacteroidota bacterium]